MVVIVEQVLFVYGLPPKRSTCNINKEARMKYRVHQLEVKKETAQEQLERFLNLLEGEVLAVVPYVAPVFQGMGATAKVDFLLIVEKI